MKNFSSFINNASNRHNFQGSRTDKFDAVTAAEKTVVTASEIINDNNNKTDEFQVSSKLLGKPTTDSATARGSVACCKVVVMDEKTSDSFASSYKTQLSAGLNPNIIVSNEEKTGNNNEAAGKDANENDHDSSSSVDKLKRNMSFKSLGSSFRSASSSNSKIRKQHNNNNRRTSRKATVVPAKIMNIDFRFLKTRTKYSPCSDFERRKSNSPRLRPNNRVAQKLASYDSASGLNTMNTTASTTSTTAGDLVSNSTRKTTNHSTLMATITFMPNSRTKYSSCLAINNQKNRNSLKSIKSLRNDATENNEQRFLFFFFFPSLY